MLNEHSVLRGTWTLALDKVSIVAYKKIVKQDMNAPSGGRKHGRKQANLMEQEHIFRMVIHLFIHSLLKPSMYYNKTKHTKT